MGEWYLLKVNVIGQLHVPGVDTEDLKTTNWVWDTNVNLTIKTTKTSKSRIDAVRSISGSNDDDIGTSLHTVHEGEELGDDTAFNFSTGLVTLRSNRVNLIDEDDCRRVLLSLLKGLTKVTLTLTGHLGHDLWSIDGEEEGTGLIGNGTSNQGLTSTRRAIHENTARRLNANALE